MALPGSCDLQLPDYDVWLGSVLPSVARSLGRPVPPGAWVGREIELPEAQRAVVVLVDGLGHELLAARGGHAPFLRAMAAPVGPLSAGFPSTTATATASLSTGLPPVVHGLVGWQALMPEQDRLLNHLSWDQGPDPATWQPHRTLFERLAGDGVDVTRVGPPYFEKSGLTRAALRGGRFRAAHSVQDRVGATVSVLRGSPGPALVYLYFGEVDKAGHVHGPDSWQWGEQVEVIDAALAELSRRLPRGTSLTVTADHGMVTGPEQLRRDLAHEPDLAHGIRHLGGEPRGPQAHCRPGAAPDVLASWRDLLGDTATVLTREEALTAGWFGPAGHPAGAGVLPRIGDVVAAMHGQTTLLDSRALRPEVLRLVGQHGSLSRAEMSVPMLHAPAT